MSLSKRIFTDALFSTGRTVASLVRALVVIPLITNLLGVGEYGIWTTTVAVVALIRSSGGFHLHGALIRYSTDSEDISQVYSDVLFLTIVLSVLCGACTYVVGHLFGLASVVGHRPWSVESLLLAAVALLMSNMVLQINLNYPRALGNVRLYEGIRTFRMVVETAVLIGVFFSGGNIVDGFVSLFAVSLSLNLVLGSVIVWTDGVVLPSLSNFRQYLEYGAPMVPKELSGSILSKMDRFLILYFISPAAAGAYAVAYGISNLLKQITAVLNSSLYPNVSAAWEQGRMAELQSLYAGIFRYMTIIIIPALFGITILGHSLIEIISTPSVADRSFLLVPILCTGFLIRAYENPIDYILTSIEKTEKIGLAVGVAALSNLVLNVVFIPTYGILGAAVATLVSEVLITVIVYNYAKQELPIPLPVRTSVKATFAGAVMFLILSLLPSLTTPTRQIGAYSVLGVVIYGGMMVSIGGVSVQEITRIIDR